MASDTAAAMQAHQNYTEELRSVDLTPGNLVAVTRRTKPRDGVKPEERLAHEVRTLLRLLELPDVAAAAAAVAALHICMRDAAAAKTDVLAALPGADEQLGRALRRPGVLEAAAAWDPDAVPALCILALVSTTRSAKIREEADSCCSLLHPAAAGCLRFAAEGGAAPLLSAALTALSAAHLALAACTAGELADEAPLLQLIQRCSAAVAADVAAAVGDAASPTTTAAAGGVHPEGRRPAGQDGDGAPQQAQLFEEQPLLEWRSAWARPVATALQALSVLHPGPPDDGSHVEPQPGPAPRDLDPAAAEAYAAGVKALLAHEAALQRGVPTVSEDGLLALMGPLGMGDSAAAAQGALVGGLSEALAGVVASLPKMGGSTQPTAAQAAALSRLTLLVRHAHQHGAIQRCRIMQDASTWDSWAVGIAAALTAAAGWAHGLRCSSDSSSPDSSCGTQGGAHGDSKGRQQRQQQRHHRHQQQKQQQRQQQQQHSMHLNMQQAAFHVGKAAELVLRHVGRSDPAIPAWDVLPDMLECLAVHYSCIRVDAVETYVQGCGEDKELRGIEARKVCLAELQAAALTLDMAVRKVAAAAKEGVPPQPSSRLVCACWGAVSAVLGVALLRFHHVCHLEGMELDSALKTMQVFMFCGEVAGSLASACGPPAFIDLGLQVVDQLLQQANAMSIFMSSPLPPVRSLPPNLQAVAQILRPPEGTGAAPGEHAPRTLLWPRDAIDGWANTIRDLTKAVQHQRAKGARDLMMPSLQEVGEVLRAVRKTATAQHPASAADCDDTELVQAQAAADAAMRELLAAEEGGQAAMAAPSKAAEKRARKKAAARAAAVAAAAAAPQPAAELSQRAQLSGMAAAAASGDAALAAADAASKLQCLGLTAEQADAGRDSSSPAAEEALQHQQPPPQPQPQRTQQCKQPPPWLLCPITKDVMGRATLCMGDGHSYDESEINQWLQTHSTSPVTGQPLMNKELLPNHALRQIIEAAGF